MQVKLVLWSEPRPSLTKEGLVRAPQRRRHSQLNKQIIFFLKLMTIQRFLAYTVGPGRIEQTVETRR